MRARGIQFFVDLTITIGVITIDIDLRGAVIDTWSRAIEFPILEVVSVNKIKKEKSYENQ
jgi:hypothetical protein